MVGWSLAGQDLPAFVVHRHTDHIRGRRGLLSRRAQAQVVEDAPNRDLVVKGAAVRVRRVDASGAPGEAVTVSDSSAARSSGFPRMVRAGREVIVAWRDAADPPKVRTAIVAVPPPRR